MPHSARDVILRVPAPEEERRPPVRLAYRTWGPAGAPPLVLLHALGEQSSDWAPVAQALASSWRVYAPDLRR